MCTISSLWFKEKYDMIGISDFLFGAMENWGLVTYRESRILVDPVTSSSSAKVTINNFRLRFGLVNSINTMQD